MDFAHLASLLGLALGAGMGAYAMINPRWASWLVRLVPDAERPGGEGEFRGTYGGLFFFTHAVALATAFHDPHGFAPLTCALIWWGTAVGRLSSIVLDRKGLPFNLWSFGFEVALGALIAAPVLV
jgi:hypothetical protein